MNIRKIVPQYHLREAIGHCDCYDGDVCDCMPELILTKNGLSGYGMAHWTYTDETCPRHIDHYGKAYWCEFLGMKGFWAMGENDAAETILQYLQTVGVAATVNFVNTDLADKIMKDLMK